MMKRFLSTGLLGLLLAFGSQGAMAPSAAQAETLHVMRGEADSTLRVPSLLVVAAAAAPPQVGQQRWDRIGWDCFHPIPMQKDQAQDSPIEPPLFVVVAAEPEPELAAE